jgi:hypothetical protein
MYFQCHGIQLHEIIVLVPGCHGSPRGGDCQAHHLTSGGPGIVCYAILVIVHLLYFLLHLFEVSSPSMLSGEAQPLALLANSSVVSRDDHAYKEFEL